MTTPIPTWPLTPDQAAYIASQVQIGMCTCHVEPKPIHRMSDDDEWAHTEDDTKAEVFHVHQESYSRDCDGPFERYTTYQVCSIVDCESAADLWAALVRMEVTAHAIRQTVEIINDDTDPVATFTEVTDEGGRSVQLRGCHDTGCAHDDSSQRDHYAEAMGY